MFRIDRKNPIFLSKHGLKKMKTEIFSWEIGPTVAARLQIMIANRRTRSLSSMPEIVQHSARVAGVDPSEEVCVEYTYGRLATLAGYESCKDREMYGADPRGCFPGRYLLVHLGWGRDHELWKDSTVSVY